MQMTWQAWAMLAGLAIASGLTGYFTQWWVAPLIFFGVVGCFALWLGVQMNTDI